tara:strand:- start:1082 stop:1342 length:261 start_codon:yes stop_codon:yes gene_type:complete
VQLSLSSTLIIVQFFNYVSIRAVLLGDILPPEISGATTAGDMDEAMLDDDEEDDGTGMEMTFKPDLMDKAEEVSKNAKKNKGSTPA